MTINAGTGIYVMGELNRADAAARRVANERNEAILERNEAIEESNRIVFAALSQIHGFRAQIQARRWVEDELITALRAENADHPLAERAVVEALFEKKRSVAMRDESVVKRTFPFGMPTGAVVDCDGVPGVVDGFPAYADPKARIDMMNALGLDKKSIQDPAVVEAALRHVSGIVARLKVDLDEDDKKGFFGKMNKKNRASAEAELQASETHLKALQRALIDAEVAAHDGTGLSNDEIADRLANYSTTTGG